MSLLDKSLKLGLFAGVTLFMAGCTAGSDTGKTTDVTDADADTDADTDADADTDTDADSDTTTIDTAIALVWYEASAQVSGGEFVSGSWGTIFTDLADLPSFDNVLCDNTGAWSLAGPRDADCPDCDWAFTLATTGTTATGDLCADFGRVGGEWDGFDKSWGFSNEYLYVYGTYEIPLEKVLWYYYDGGGYWFFLAYNYGGYGYNEGDASDMTARRNYGYYYFYP